MKFPDGLKRGRSELVLKSLAQLFGGLGHVLTLPMQVYLWSHRVLHRRVGPSHGIAAAELGPRDSHALYVTQPGLHDLFFFSRSSAERLNFDQSSRFNRDPNQ